MNSYDTTNKVGTVIIIIYLTFFFVVLGFELGALLLLGKLSTTLRHVSFLLLGGYYYF
jgi:hypothetical protein